MSVHEDLFDEGAALVLEVQGRPALLSFWTPGQSEPLVIDGSVGATRIERLESETNGVHERRLRETATVRASCRTGRGVLWTPQFAMKVTIGADATRWTVTEIRGLGTAIYTIDLVRSFEVNKQAAGREEAR